MLVDKLGMRFVATLSLHNDVGESVIIQDASVMLVLAVEACEEFVIICSARSINKKTLPRHTRLVLKSLVQLSVQGSGKCD